MKAKKHQLFLRLGLSLFTLFLVIYLVQIVSLINKYNALIPTLSPNDQNQFGFAFTIELFAYVFFGVPALLLELSCTRSIYKILKYDLHGSIKVCYIISAITALAAFIFQCLIFFGVIVFATTNIKIQDNVMLLTTWAPFILSFALGSISSRCTKDTSKQGGI